MKNRIAEHLPAQPKAELPVVMQTMTKDDIDEIMCIERQCFEYCWSRRDFREVVNSPRYVKALAMHREEIVGYIVFEIHPEFLMVVTLAVFDKVRRRGVGSILMAVATGYAASFHKRRVELLVRESNLTAQLFFKKLGFKCVQTIRDHYPQNDEAAYAMALPVTPDLKCGGM